MLKQKDWIEVIVAKTGCTKKDAKVFYDCVFDYMREQISPEEAIKISGFGVLKLRKTAAKEQINLITGQPEIVPEHNVVTFRPYFEIDAKPEPIEVEDEDVVVTDVTTDVPVAEETSAPAVEEVPAVVEEPTVVEEVPVVEETPVVVPASKDGLTWVVGDATCTTADVRALLLEKTKLVAEDVDASLDVVKENLRKLNKTTVEVKETDNSFDFVIVK